MLQADFAIFAKIFHKLAIMSRVLIQNCENWRNQQISYMKCLKIAFSSILPLITHIIADLWKMWAKFTKFACNKTFGLLQSLNCYSDKIHRKVGDVFFCQQFYPKIVKIEKISKYRTWNAKKIILALWTLTLFITTHMWHTSTEIQKNPFN